MIYIERERKCVNPGNITARKSGYDMIYMISWDMSHQQDVLVMGITARVGGVHKQNR
jgi:hypothetical protein